MEGAEAFGVHFRVRPFILGVFLLGFGTSLPELVISTLSAAQGVGEIAIGNVIGANVTNLLLILGISAFIARKAKIDFDLLQFDLPLFVVSAFLMIVTVWDGVFTYLEGLIFLGIFAVYLTYAFMSRRKDKIARIPDKGKITWREVVKLIAGPVIMYVGARYAVQAVVALSETLSIGSGVIAATAVSFGTTLPELAVSYAAVKRRRMDEMLGNIIGSNIFNILVVLSVPSLIRTLTAPDDMVKKALPLMIVATAASFIVIRDKRITRAEGVLLLIAYGAYLAVLLGVL